MNIKKTVLKDLVYFSRNFFMNVKLKKHQRQHQMAPTNREGANLRIYGSSASLLEEGSSKIYSNRPSATRSEVSPPLHTLLS